MPSREEVKKWWNSVQQALNDANADVDMTKKEDLLRFRVVEFPRIGIKDNTFGDADSSSYMAFVDDKNFDYAKAADNEILENQNNSPSDEKIEELYNVAKEGRLFFNSIPERQCKPRQLVVGKDGNAEVRPDIDHVTNEMDICMDCIREPDQPDKTKYKTSFFTKVLAFFGNKKAKTEIEKKKVGYERAIEKYNKRLANWQATKEMNPDFVKQNQNLALANFTHFSIPADEDALEREMKMEDLGYYAHKDMIVNELTTKADEAIKSSSQSLLALNSADPEMTSTKEALIAKLIFNQSVKDKIMSERENDQLPEENAARYNKQLTEGTPENKHQLSLFEGSRAFKTAVQKLTNEEIGAMVNKPSEASKKMLQMISDEIKEAETKQKSPEPVTRKQNTKDDVKASKTFAPV